MLPKSCLNSPFTPASRLELLRRARLFQESRSGIRSIHARDLATDTLPFHLPLDASTAALPLTIFLACPLKLEMLIPLHELIHETKVRLDDDVEAAGSDEAALKTSVRMEQREKSGCDGGDTRMVLDGGADSGVGRRSRAHLLSSRKGDALQKS